MRAGVATRKIAIITGETVQRPDRSQPNPKRQPMTESFQPEKWIFTEADYESMGWHDSNIHAISFLPETFELVLDIDYILQWIHPEPRCPTLE